MIAVSHSLSRPARPLRLSLSAAHRLPLRIGCRLPPSSGAARRARAPPAPPPWCRARRGRRSASCGVAAC
eukprot:1208255-Prymnesium_polylepis.1